MVESGFRFELTASVANKMSFRGEDGPVNLFKVLWMGGAKSFLLDSKEELDVLPAVGTLVRITGSMFWEKGKAPLLTMVNCAELDPTTGKVKRAA